MTPVEASNIPQKEQTPQMYTSQDAVEDVRTAVLHKGRDYVYKEDSLSTSRRCVYVEDGAPSCIVGHILYRRGVGLATLERFDGADGWAISSAAEVVPRVLPDLSTEALDILALAQDLQDGRWPWGRVLDAVEAYAQPHNDGEHFDRETLTWCSCDYDDDYHVGS